MSNADGQLYAEQELTAILFALAGIEIQRTAARDSDGVSSHKLLKTIANCVWDYGLLPKVSKGGVGVSRPGDLVWTPHRYGALGLIKASRAYSSVRVSYGSFCYPQYIVHRGTYQKYNIAIKYPSPRMRRFVFPDYLSFETITKSGIERIDQTIWPELVGIYAKLDDRSLNCLASCRNEAAAVHSLWIELVFFLHGLQETCEQLEEDPSVLERAENREALNGTALRTFAAAREFRYKLELLNRRDEAVDRAHRLSVRSQLHEYIPITHSNVAPPIALGRFIQIAEKINSVSLIVESLFRCVGLGEHDGSIVDIETCCHSVRNMVAFEEVAGLYYGPEPREIARLCWRLCSQLRSSCECALGMVVMDPIAHYRSFFESFYPA